MRNLDITLVVLGLFGLPLATRAQQTITQSDLKPGFDKPTGTVIDSRWKSGMPLGGIGVGKIELLTDGSFGNFTNQHNWDRPYGWARGAFAAIRVQTGTAKPRADILRLASPDEYTAVANVKHTRMNGWFPRADIDFTDETLPVSVHLSAFSPLTPHDPKDSSLPIAALTYTISNPGASTVHASLLLAWPNLIGWGGRTNAQTNNEIWESLDGNLQEEDVAGNLKGLRYTTRQSYADQRRNTIGDDFIALRQDPGIEFSVCESWDAAAVTPSFWSHWVASGLLGGQLSEGSREAVSQPAGAISGQVTLAPGQSRTLRFYVCWAMPHMITTQMRQTESDIFEPTSAGVSALFDNDLTTRWTTSRAMQKGDNLVIDLGAPQTIKQLIMDCGKTETDYPHGLRVEVSSDGMKWQSIAEKDAGSLKSTAHNIDLPGSRGRYLRLTNLGSDSFYWWSMYDLKINVQGQQDPVHPPDSAIVAYLRHMGPIAVSEDVGHYWQNWWHSPEEIAQYFDIHSDDLLQQTRTWQDGVIKSNLPFWLKLKLINCAFPLFSNTILTRDGRFAVQESPIDMAGALGTMDQRMAAHAFYTAFFPELDRAELEMFASCQQDDGRITHFDGNIHEVVGRPDVGYGITDWPDLSSAWVLQAVKLYRWTGDSGFLARMQSHIASAMDWLNKDGLDDDGIPAGGSTYDYEQLPRGAFIYSASCYLGALGAAAAVAEPDRATVYTDRLIHTQAAVMNDLWNGTFFRKWKQTTTGETVEDSFVANLAGDWLARLTGLPRTLKPEIIHQSIAQTIARHQKGFFPVPPMQTTPAGKLTTSSCYLLQHEPYLGCESIYENYVDDGMETLRRVYFCVWELNHSPWNESLTYGAPGGTQGGLVTYMTCPTTWHALNALAGTSIDLPHNALFVSPRLASDMQELHIPVYFSRFWAWLDYVPAAHRLTLRIDRIFNDNPEVQKSLYHASGPGADFAPAAISIATVQKDGDSAPISLPQPFMVQVGSILDLSPFISQLTPEGPSEKVDFVIKAKVDRPGLPSDNWILTDNVRDNPELAAAYGQLALDGYSETRWTTERLMRAGDQITLDMGLSQNVARFVLDSAKSPDDYPKGYKLEWSTDGKTWKEAAHASAEETRRSVNAGVLSISFAPVQARWLRLTNLEADPAHYWSIHELNVYGP